MLPLLDSNGVAINKGRFIDLIDGIEKSMAAGGVASINVPVNRHSPAVSCAAIELHRRHLQATKRLTGGGNDALVGTVASCSATQVPLTFTATNSRQTAPT